MSVLLVKPKRFGDHRGWFSETFNREKMQAHGVDHDWCQDNQSMSSAVGTIRGLHFQAPPFAQAKLVRCPRGRLLDVAVDVRKESPTFGQWVSAELSAENGHQLYVPSGYAHGFVTLEPDTEIAYKVDAPYNATSDGGISWDDPALGIDWGLEGDPVVSDKDRTLPTLAELDVVFPYDGKPLEPLREIIP